MTASLDYRSLFAALPSAHVVLEPRPPYRILDVNDAYAHASLRPREALVGHGLFEAFPDRPDEPEGAGSARLRQSFELAVATRGPHALPAQRYDIPSPGGGFKTRWWRATTIPVLDAAGTVTHLLHCSEDVTALMTAQAGRAAAEESEARLRALFEQAAAGILVVDLAGRFVTVNDRFCTLVGRSREELLGLSSLDVTHPDDVAASLDVYRRIAAGGGSVSLEKRYLRPDGTAVWASLSASPARGPDGRIVHVVGVVHEVTELHRTAAALRERESKYRSLFESIDEGFCVVQMIFDDAGRPVDYRFLEANPAFVEQSGLVDAVGRTMRELHSGHEQHWFDIYGGVALTGEPVRFQNYAGSLGRWFDVYAFRIGDSEARQVAVLFRDVTERRRTETSLEESRAQLLRVFELSPTFLAVLRGPAHVFELANPSYDRLVGHRPVLGRPIREALPELEGQGFFELLDAVYRTGEPFVGNEVHAELRPAPDGAPEQHWVNFLYQPLRETDGTVSGILVSGTDVTELVASRRATEQALAETERVAAERDAERQTLRTVLEQSPLAVALIEAPDGRIAFLNSKFAEIFGYAVQLDRAEEYSGTYHGFHADGRPIASDEWPVARALLRGETTTGERLEVLHASGRRVQIEANAAPVRDADGRIIAAVALFRDVTAERRTEAQLREAQRLHAVGTLAGGVAHEVNNALQGVLGFGSFVLRALGSEHPQAADMRRVLESAERAARVSQQLLAYSRQQVTQPRPVDLERLLEGLAPVLQRLLGADKTLEVAPAAAAAGPAAPERPAPPIHADPGQVEQVLINLVANARDATETGARVTIAVEPADVPDEEAGAATLGMGFALPPGRYVRLTVRDTGHGMDRTTLARIFDPFFTTKPVGRGTGLGLSMVYGTVKQHGGWIGVRSAPGAGTTVEIYWPVAAADAVAESAPPPYGVRAAAGRGRTVLVAEDEPLVRDLAARTLEAEGYRVLAAEDGAAALARLEAEAAPPDLVVTDVVMPRRNGRQLHDAVAARWPGVPVLFISGHPGDDAVLQRLVPAGAPFLQKPFAPEALAQRVAELLA